jgi:hypothetical protein
MVERTLETPELILPDPNDATVERCFRRIPEFGGRVLRVAVNRTVEPNRVVSVFFDRKMKANYEIARGQGSRCALPASGRLQDH